MKILFCSRQATVSALYTLPMVLLIEGAKKNRFNFQNPKGEHESFKINGETVLLAEKEEENNGLDGREATSLVVWDCSLVLAKYLESLYCGQRSTKKLVCLELGAGRGLVGLSLSKLRNVFGKIILSDIKQAIPLLEASIKLNGGESSTAVGTCAGETFKEVTTISAIPIDWLAPEYSIKIFREKEEKPDVIVLADCIWVLDLIQPLVETIVAFMNNQTSVVYVAHQTRSIKADELFFSLLRKAHLAVEKIEAKDHHMQVAFTALDIDTSSPILIFKLCYQS